MEVSIDIDLLAAPSTAVGQISGKLDLLALPHIGETLSFMFNKTDAVFPIGSGFSGLLKVENVIYPVDRGFPPIVGLEPIQATSGEHAQSIARYLEDAFGLNFDPYDSRTA
jgi:hypothetical protein